MIDLQHRNKSIEFITADCALNCHFGYAYIDGLCNSLEDQKPKPILKNFYDTYCKNQDLIIDGSQSYGYNQFGWSVCEVSGGQELNCVIDDLSASGPIGLLNIKDFYASGGQSLTCGKTYRVRLSLDNDCGEPVTVSKDVAYLCEDGVVVDYSDIINCAGEQANVQITGSILNCPNCNIAWTPAQYLNNSSLPDPIIQGSLNVLALSQIYHIVAQDALGCIDEDDVAINNLHTGNFTASALYTLCDVTLKAKFEAVFPTMRGNITVKFINITTGQVLSGTIDGNLQSSLNWAFSSISIKKNEFPSGYWQALFEFVFPDQNNCVSRTVNIGQVNQSDTY